MNLWHELLASSTYYRIHMLSILTLRFIPEAFLINNIHKQNKKVWFVQRQQQPGVLIENRTALGEALSRPWVRDGPCFELLNMELAVESKERKAEQHGFAQAQ